MYYTTNDKWNKIRTCYNTVVKFVDIKQFFQKANNNDYYVITKHERNMDSTISFDTLLFWRH